MSIKWPEKKDVSTHKIYPTRNEMTSQGYDYGWNAAIDACKQAYEAHEVMVNTEWDEDKIYQFMCDYLPEFCPRNNETGKDFQMGIKAIRRGRMIIEAINKASNKASRELEPLDYDKHLRPLFDDVYNRKIINHSELKEKCSHFGSTVNGGSLDVGAETKKHWDNLIFLSKKMEEMEKMYFEKKESFIHGPTTRKEEFER